MSGLDLDALASAWPHSPWTGVAADDLAHGLKVPSMLQDDAAALYHWLGRQAQGVGATLDLGTFLGGSAARLLSGLALSGQPFHLHGFDRFTSGTAARDRYLQGHAPIPGDNTDILPLAQAFLAPWAPHVTLHRGDIARMDWTGGPVGIAAIDAAKTPEVADRIAAQVFPALIPGRSVVIHLDALHSAQPWLAVQMARLATALRPLGRVSRNGLVFGCTAPVTPDLIFAARTARLDDAALIAAVQNAADTFAPAIPRPRFRAMVQTVKANPGVRVAWKMRPPPAAPERGRDTGPAAMRAARAKT